MTLVKSTHGGLAVTALRRSTVIITLMNESIEKFKNDWKKNHPLQRARNCATKYYKITLLKQIAVIC